MGLPEEDLGPVWLRDYGEIQADITRMAEFAAQLKAEVIESYIPHLARVDAEMSVELPAPCEAFRELVDFLQTHHAAQQDTTNLVHYYRDATGGFALAANEISERYRGTDAFAAARVHVVEEALKPTAVAAPPPDGASQGAS